MNNKFWLFERKHYLHRPILTTGDLIMQTALSSFHLPVITSSEHCYQPGKHITIVFHYKLWTSKASGRNRCQWHNIVLNWPSETIPILNECWIFFFLNTAQQIKRFFKAQKCYSRDVKQDTSRPQFAEDWIGTGITWYRDLFVMLIDSKSNYSFNIPSQRCIDSSPF